MYYAVRLAGGDIVAIEFSHNGRLWRADTPEEAIRLRESLELASLRKKTDHGEDLQLREQTVWTPDVYWDFVNSIGELQLGFLKVLFEQSEEDSHVLMPSEEVTKKLKMHAETELGGMLSGLSKQLKKLGLRPHNLYYVDVSWEGRTKERSFGLEPEFVLAAKELGWPNK
jgi:hypothetical protein